MFDIGLQELIVIFAVALIVFGPKRLPEIGKSLGRGLAELKRAMEDVKQQVNSEVGDLKDPLDLKNQLFMNKDAPPAQEKTPESHSSESDNQDTILPSGEGSISDVQDTDKDVTADTDSNDNAGAKS